MKRKNPPRVLNVVGTLWDVWPTINGIDREFDARYLTFYPPLLKGRIPRSRITELNERSTWKILWPWKLIMRTIAVIRVIREFDPEYVVSQHDDANLSVIPALLWCRVFRRSVTFIAWARADPERGYSDAFYTRVIRFFARFGYNRFDAVVTPSEGNRHQLISVYGVTASRVLAVHNPIDVANIESASKQSLPKARAALFTAGKTFLTVGRLTEQKGQWHLLRAFAAVARKDPLARLVILGHGELKEYLTTLATHLGIAHRVHFLGFQADALAYIARSRALVLPSLWETFGNVVIEGLGAGVPVIATDCASGPREILADENGSRKAQHIERATYGILVPLPDGKRRDAGVPLTPEEQALADAMLLLLTNASLVKRYSAVGRRRAAKFDISKTAYRELFASIAARSRRRK